MHRHITTLTVLFFCLPVVGLAAVIHVPADQPTIQAGIDAAADGDTVLVADGTYTGTGNKNLDFSGKAITVRSNNGPESCVIDCQGSGRGFQFEDHETDSSVVQGFTIRNGDVFGDGGGISCFNSSHPTIRGNTITGNSANMGGGIACETNSNPTIIDNVISGNSSNDSGGGIFCVESSPLIIGNTIMENESGGGGGIETWWSSAPVIMNNNINGNSARWGGGIECFGGDDSNIVNNLIVGNTAEFTGGGIRCSDYSSTSITGNILFGNEAGTEGGGLYSRNYTHPTVTKCILWSNTAPVITHHNNGEPVVTFSDIQGSYAGEGNIDDDPLFVSGPLGEYYLSQIVTGHSTDSPCIDSGDPTSEMIWGTTRTDHVHDMGIVDMGYHYPWQSVKSQMACTPVSGTLPFQAQFGVQLTNNYMESTRAIDARINVFLASGLEIPNWKTGSLNLGPGTSFTTGFTQTIPDIQVVSGMNTFTLIAEDVTPAPFNQAPYPPSGDTDTAGCTVMGIAP